MKDQIHILGEKNCWLQDIQKEEQVREEGRRYEM